MTSRTLTLTTGSDVITGTSSADTVYGSAVGSITTDSLQAFDQINGGAGNDTLSISLTGGDYDGTATISNIENVVARATGAGRAFDFGNMTGVTSFTNDRSTAALTVTGVDTTSAAIVLDRVATSTDMDVSFLASALTGTTTAASVTLKGVGATGTTGVLELYGAAGTTDGIETLNLHSSGTASYLQDLIVDTTNGSGTETMTKLVFDGSADVTVTNAIDFAGTTGTVDASTATGGLSVVLATAETVTVTGGAGNDSFSFTTGLTVDDSVNGGAGTDTVKFVATSFTLASNKISNVEVLDQQAAAGANNLTMVTGGTTLTKVVLREVANASDQNVTVSDLAAGAAVDIVQVTDGQMVGVATLGLKDASGTADALTVTLKGVIGHGTTDNEVGDLVVTNIETLNLVSAGTTSTALAATDANLVSDISTDTALTSINASGASALTVIVGTEATKLTKFDGSAMTADLAVTLGAGDVSVTSGSGDDTLAFGTTLNNKDTVVGGANSLSTTEDTLTADVTGLTATTGALNVSGVERLNLTVSATSVVDATKVTGATEIGLSFGGTTTTVSGLAAASKLGLGFKSGDLAGTQAFGTITASLADATGTADSLTFNLNAVDDGNTGDNHTATLKTTDIETVNLAYSTTGTENAFYSITSANLAASTINVTGSDADTANTLALNTLSTSTSKVDASAYKGILTATASATATTFNLNGGVVHNVTGAAGNDTFTVAAGAAQVNLDGGTGTDTLNMTLNGAFSEADLDLFEVINVTVSNSSTVTSATTITAKGINESTTTKFTVAGGNSLSTWSHGGTVAIGLANGSEAAGLVTYDMSGFTGKSTTVAFGDSVLDTDLTVTGSASTADTVAAYYEAAASEVLKVSAVETIKLSVDNGGDDSETYNFDMSNVTGATTIAISMGAAATDDANVANFTGLAAGANIALGSTIGEVFGTSTVSATLATATGTSDALTLTLVDTNNADNTVVFTSVGTETLNVAVDATAEDHSINLAGVTQTGTTAGTINITGGLDDVGGAGSALTVTSVASTVTTVNASALIGTFTLSDRGSSAMTITGGTGADNIRMEHANDVLDASTSATSATKDTLTIAQNAVLGGFAIDLSSTTDQVTTYNGSSNSAVQKGFENVNLSGITGVFGADVTANSVGSTITGTTNADVITAGAGVDNVVIASSGTTSDTINSFTKAASGDVINISIASGGLVDGDNTAVAAGAADLNEDAAGAVTLGATDNILILLGATYTAATVDTALEAGGGRAVTWSGSPTADANFLVVYTDGTDAYLATVNDTDTTDDTALEAGDATVTVLAKIVGVTSLAAGTFDVSNFAFVA